MNTAVLIVLIICITLLLMVAIVTYGNYKEQNSDILKRIKSDLEWFQINQTSNDYQLNRIAALISELRNELKANNNPEQQNN